MQEFCIRCGSRKVTKANKQLFRCDECGKGWSPNVRRPKGEKLPKPKD